MEARVEHGSPASYATIPTHNRYALLDNTAEVEVSQETENMDQASQRGGVSRRQSPQPLVLEGIHEETEEEHDSRDEENVVPEDCDESQEESPESDQVGVIGRSEGSEDEINIASMQTGQLWLVPVTAGANIQTNALIDTGSTNNLIKESLADRLGEVNPTLKFQIRGVGTLGIETRGRIQVAMEIAGIAFPQVQFEVVADADMKHEMVLGVSFFVSESVVVDMANRRLTIHRVDGAHTDIYVDQQLGRTRVVEEDVSVVAAQEVQVERGEAIWVPIRMQRESAELPESLALYYEDMGINRKVIGVRGLIDLAEPRVLVHLGQRSGQAKHTIREGDVLGTVTTMPHYDSENSPEVWTPEELRCHEKLNLGKDLDPEEREAVLQMLEDHSETISKGEFDIGEAKGTPHWIELTSEAPIWMKPRKFSEPVNREIERQCQELLGLGLIEHSESPFSAAIVPVNKRDNTGLRMCVDYRRLNAVTKTEKFPMPNLTDLVYRAGGVRYFTKLDVTKGYYHVPLEEGSRKYTAFSTHQNHYQFKTLSFGLKNSGIAFQRCMQQILAQCCSKDVMCYIDDILITSSDFETHLTLVGKVLQTLARNGMKVKLSKCEFFQTEVSFLGHLLSREGIKKDPAYVKAVQEYPKPKDLTELRRFLGLVNFQRKFVKDCSTIAKPLTEVTGGPKRKPLAWNETMVQAFETLKEELGKEVTLTFPEYGEHAAPLRLFVDASGVGAGACLFQKQDEENRAVAYASTTFSETERKYSTIERELTAVRWGVKLFRPFLMGVSFELWTDHKPLLHMQNMAQDKSKFMRTMDELAEYDFVIRYIPGRDNEAADALSRILQDPAEPEESEGTMECILPQGFEVREPVPGGGDSLFTAVIRCLMRTRPADLLIPVPETATQLREKAVDHMLKNPGKYGLKLNKEEKRRCVAMRKPGRVPSETVLMAIAVVCRVEVWVHHGGVTTVAYKEEEQESGVKLPRIHLQCVSGIHFNPVETVRKPEDYTHLVAADHVNVLQNTNLELGTTAWTEVQEEAIQSACTHVKV